VLDEHQLSPGIIGEQNKVVEMMVQVIGENLWVITA
jgi:hypothetical protein